MSAKAILFSQMQPPEGQEGRFNDWYNHDHVPARVVLPGFTSATRYRAESGTTDDYLAVYELDSLEALSSPGYRQLKTSPTAETDYMLSAVEGFTRFTCVELSSTGTAPNGAFLSVVAFSVPPEAEPQFTEWYDNEHTPLLMEASDWLRVRRYKVIDGEGGPWTHLALHDLASLEVLDSPERARARSGPLRAAIAGEPWFGNSGRWVYRLINSRVAALASSVKEEEPR